MNTQIFIDMIHVAVIASIISSQTIQRLKKIFNHKSLFNSIMASFISFTVGFTYALSFYSHNLLYDIWIGLFTLIGAEGIYKSFKGSFGLESNDNA